MGRFPFGASHASIVGIVCAWGQYPASCKREFTARAERAAVAGCAYPVPVARSLHAAFSGLQESAEGTAFGQLGPETTGGIPRRRGLGRGKCDTDSEEKATFAAPVAMPSRACRIGSNVALGRGAGRRGFTPSGGACAWRRTATSAGLSACRAACAVHRGIRNVSSTPEEGPRESSPGRRRGRIIAIPHPHSERGVGFYFSSPSPRWKGAKSCLGPAGSGSLPDYGLFFDE